MTLNPDDLTKAQLSRRGLIKAGAGAGLTAAMIANMTWPKSMSAQTPAAVGSPMAAGSPMAVGTIPAKTLSGTLITTIPGEPLSFNPDLQVDDNVWPVACNIYNSLFMLNNDYAVIPDLATGYTIADDGLSITVNINPLATWHDGTPATSADVKYTLEQIVATPAAPASSLIAAISSVDTPEEKVAVINLAQASASVIGFLSWYGVFILPAHLYEGTDWATNEANLNPVGTGPFKFSSYTAAQSVELVANENYFAEGPYLEKLIFQIIPDANTAAQALTTGEVDFVAIPNAQVAQFESDSNYKVSGKVYPSPFYIGFNLNAEPFNNIDVRKAVGMAIDRDQIIATALGSYGTPENRYYPAQIDWASNPDSVAPAFDVDGANALLDPIYPKSGDNRFSTKFLYFTGWPELADVSTVMKEQLSAIGIDAELVLLEFAAYEDQLKAGDFGIGIIGGFQGPDPANLAIRWKTGTGLNYWGFTNTEFDDLLAQGDAAATTEERQGIYFQAQEILANEVPGILIAEQTFFNGVPTTVTGVWLDADDPVALLVGMNRFTLTQIAQ